MTTRVTELIESIAQLSSSERAELALHLPELRSTNDQHRPVCHGADLARLFETVTPDPEFADDIEAGMRERRTMRSSIR